jgi:hypothetical protein
MVLQILRLLACVALLFASPAWAKPPAKAATDVPTAESLDADATQEADPAEGEPAEEGSQSAGIECSPAISEIETRRPIPLSCSVTKEGVDQVEVRYKAPGRKKWTKLRLRKVGEDFQAEIPCLAVTKRGTLKLSIVGLDADEKTIVRVSGVSRRCAVTRQPNVRTS